MVSHLVAMFVSLAIYFFKFELPMMLRNVFYTLLMVVFAGLLTPVWAEGDKACAYQDSGVDLNKVKKSPLVLGFDQLEKNARYAGTLKGVGGFYLELFACTHRGARFTVMLGPDDDIASLNAALKALPDLLFSQSDALQVSNELRGVQLDGNLAQVFLDDLAKALGLTQVTVQLVEADGMGLLVFQFYGG